MGAVILLAGALYRSIRDALADQRSGTLQPIKATPSLPRAEESSAQEVMPENRSTECSVTFSKFYPEETVKSALSYKPNAGEVFAVSFPMCGSYWVQQIVYRILNEDGPPSTLLERASHLPLLELQGAEAAAAIPKPGCMRTHLPFNLVPYSEHAKYIYVARNPYDVCASFYAEALKNHPSGDEGFKQFPAFFEQFVNGQTACGDYLANLLSWYERRFDDNVFFLTYEDLIQGHRTWILRIADFIGVGTEYGDKLRDNRKLLDQICFDTSYETMCENIVKNATLFVEEVAAIPEERKPEWMKRLLKVESPEMIAQRFASTAQSGREAAIWKRLVTPDMIETMQSKISALHGSSGDVMTLWKRSY